MDSELKEYLVQMEKRIVEQTAERIHDTETRLLLAFRNWAVRVESAIKVSRATTDGLDARLVVVEERLDAMDGQR